MLSLDATPTTGTPISSIDLDVTLDCNMRCVYSFKEKRRKQILDRIAGKIGAPPEKTPLCLADYANTSAASIPLALGAALAENDSVRPLRTLFCGFGVGLSCAVAAADLVPEGILAPVETDAAFQEGEIRGSADLEE